MTTAADRRAVRRGSALRCVWAALVALIAALAVLVHHDTTSTAMAGGDYSATVMPMTALTAAMPMTAATPPGNGTALQAADTAKSDDDCVCSGPAGQHCAAGDVSTAKLAPPPAAAHVTRAQAARVLAGYGLPTPSHRAPPDLSVLSRLLI